MNSLPFKTYGEAVEHFGMAMPFQFINTLFEIDTLCQQHGLDTMDTLFDLFQMLSLEGAELRYHQTPIELFPFARTGSNGIHYGFIMHTTDEDDYPAAEFGPMDFDGAFAISKNASEVFQNLLRVDFIDSQFRPVIEKLKLAAVTEERSIYDSSEKLNRIEIKVKPGWRFIETMDGAGVYAEEKHFAYTHFTTYNSLNPEKAIADYLELAGEMKIQGRHASQLFYLKELYWMEWTNYTLAIGLLKQMIEAYEKLQRPHLVGAALQQINLLQSIVG